MSTPYERCHELRCRIRSVSRRGAHEHTHVLHRLEQDLRWLSELRQRRQQEVTGPDIVALPPLPRCVEAEQIVIGAVLARYWPATAVALSPRDFWLPLHRGVWSALIDPGSGRLSVEAVRRARITSVWPVDAVAYLHDLRDRVWPAARHQGVKIWALIVRTRSQQRQVIAAMQRIDAVLRGGDQPSARLLRWTARRLEQMAVDGHAT